jgi:sugar (pentulose or hexulose) kinase
MGPGQWCTTIGTTLVIKGVSEQIAHDPEGRLYSHRHPDGFWLPGGAGNTGAKILERHVSRQDRDTFSRAALDQSPTGLATYPLEGTGERFPFVRPQARAFIVGDSGTVDMDDLVPETRFTACLEGVAMVERLAYEIIAEIGLAVDGPIRTSGGGSRNEAWLQIRADILERTLIKAAEASGAFGAAVLAASQTQFDSLHAAAAAMVQTETITEPRPEYRGRYEAQYQRFKDELTKRGYI